MFFLSFFFFYFSLFSFNNLSAACFNTSSVLPLFFFFILCLLFIKKKKNLFTETESCKILYHMFVFLCIKRRRRNTSNTNFFCQPSSKLPVSQIGFFESSSILIFRFHVSVLIHCVSVCENEE